MKPLNIVHIASECAPFAKTGGLADVVPALAKALYRLNHNVIVILPKYAFIDFDHFNLRPFLAPLGVWMGDGEEWYAVHTADYNGLSIYFIESHKYFDRFGLYHDADFNDYQDNPRRLLAFSPGRRCSCAGIWDSHLISSMPTTGKQPWRQPT